MQLNSRLVIGQTYMTREGVTVTPIAEITSDKALFVSEEFLPTPFVIWNYHLERQSAKYDIFQIYLESGEYFFTLEEALNHG